MNYLVYRSNFKDFWYKYEDKIEVNHYKEINPGKRFLILEYK